MTEKSAGKTDGGSVDLIWINGEFRCAMKREKLRYSVPSRHCCRTCCWSIQTQADDLVDFTVPTDGLESPWGMAQFTFFYDMARSMRRRVP